MPLLKSIRQAPAPGPLQAPFLLPGMFFPSYPRDSLPLLLSHLSQMSSLVRVGLLTTHSIYNYSPSPILLLLLPALIFHLPRPHLTLSLSYLFILFTSVSPPKEQQLTADPQHLELSHSRCSVNALE